MRLVIDDRSAEKRITAPGQLPVSVGIGPQGPYAEPLQEQAWLNGQPLVERRSLAHGDVLRAGGLYLFVLHDAAGVRLVVDRHADAAVAPPLLEDANAPPSSRAFLKPVGSRDRAVRNDTANGAGRSRAPHTRRLLLIAVMAGLAAVLWVPRRVSPPQSQLVPAARAPAAPVAQPPTPEPPPANNDQPQAPPPSAAVNTAPKGGVGQVTVRGEPADAQVFVEGQAKGRAGKTLLLPATTLQLEVRRDGYQTFAASVTPQPGFPRIVDYRLQTPEQAQAERIPAVIRTQTGIELRLMPTGSFEMGSARRDAGSRANESRRAVILQRRFYLGAKEITNADYTRFKPDHLSGIVKDRSLDQDTHPVVNVSWREAAEFCNWLSSQDGLTPAYEQQGENLGLVSPATTGYRLPTEAEWEWAARADAKGQATRRYPWGQDLPLPPASGNYADRSSLVILETAIEGYDDGYPTTAPVGRFQPNPLGLFDIGGNVSEWVHDFYSVYRELDAGSPTDPTGPASGTRYTIRGSNWKTASLTELRLFWRETGEKSQTLGFRIARYAQ